MGEYKPLTFFEALLLVIRAPSNGGVSSPLKLKNDQSPPRWVDCIQNSNYRSSKPRRLRAYLVTELSLTKSWFGPQKRKLGVKPKTKPNFHSVTAGQGRLGLIWVCHTTHQTFVIAVCCSPFPITSSTKSFIFDSNLVHSSITHSQYSDMIFPQFCSMINTLQLMLICPASLGPTALNDAKGILATCRVTWQKTGEFWSM